MKKLRRNKGITLIALVITIIVLLILAAVSIATLTGENGILTKAKNASEETKKANAEEQVKTAVMASYGEDGKLDYEDLRDNLNKIPRIKGVPDVITEESFPLTVEVDEYEVEISDTYEVSSTGKNGKENSTVTAEEVNALIGQTVESYKSSEKVEKWRIFYASDTEVFLISSNTIPTEMQFGKYMGIPFRKKYVVQNYIGSEDEVFKNGYGAKYNRLYNKLWYDKGMKGAVINAGEEIVQAIAYLCDIENWTEFVADNAPIGTYSVGGSTLELFIKSWNASIPQTNVQLAVLEENDVNEIGYAHRKPDQLNIGSPMKQSILDGLYNNDTNYFLASPCSGPSQQNLITVLDWGDTATSNPYSTYFGLRPLVSIPMSAVKIEKGTLKIEQNENIEPDPPSLVVAKNAKTYYGSEVRGYQTGKGVDKWRIFYADETNIYLIADDYITVDDAPVTKSGYKLYDNDPEGAHCRVSFKDVYKDYEGSAWILGQTDGEDNSLAKKWLKGYFDYRTKEGTYPNRESTNPNIRAVAYLMDTGIWSKFAEEDLAEYAIGGPPIEMYWISYLHTYGLNIGDQKPANVSVESANGYTIRYFYLRKEYNEIYGKYSPEKVNKSSFMWLASPSSYNINLIDSAAGYNSQADYGTYFYTYTTEQMDVSAGLCPVVCLKSSVELEKVEGEEGVYQIKNN